MPETVFVNGLKAKNSKAFLKLYEMYYEKVYEIVSKRLGGGGEAEDATQEVMITIYERIHKFDPARGRFFTWVMRIAIFYSLDVLKSKDYRNQKLNVVITKNDIDYTTDPNLISWLNDVSSIGIRDVIELLPLSSKQIIDTIHYQGFTLQETAEILNRPLGTIKSRYHRALLRLRPLMK